MTVNAPAPPLSGISLVPVPTEHVATLWPQAEGHLRRACARSVGDMSPETLFRDCAAGTSALVVIVDMRTDPSTMPAAAVVHFPRQADGSLACELRAAGGRALALWRHVVPEFEAWARHVGAASVRLCGRRGWERVFPGYRARPLVSLVKEL
ncbi:hypothetical protein [Methylobacterium pseudosasicola]|uniref:Uncharacterized protein n=1 Tax=Methylobacterium pseudosasicola TaxID=582667 RepID=A0A1I4SDL8_9HYPH|nr:hypothetical protein [Methylobacterium pseudosasicola]SFM62545.1 hypothetical protein SAMN05192568_104166 [Methylobacterium pseudosasicola]